HRPGGFSGLGGRSRGWPSRVDQALGALRSRRRCQSSHYDHAGRGGLKIPRLGFHGASMNRAQAYRSGVNSGYEAGIYGEFSANELANVDAFTEAAAETCENKRQFADSPTYEFARQPK